MTTSLFNIIDAITALKQSDIKGEMSFVFDGKINQIPTKINYTITLGLESEPTIPLNPEIIALNPEILPLNPETNTISALTLNKDYVAIAYNNQTIKIIYIHRKKLINTISHGRTGLKFMAFAPTTNHLVCCFVGQTSDICIYDVHNANIIRENIRAISSLNDKITSFAVSTSSNNEIIVVGTFKRKIYVYSFALQQIYYYQTNAPFAITNISISVEKNNFMFMQNYVLRSCDYRTKNCVSKKFRVIHHRLTISQDQTILVLILMNLIKIYSTDTIFLREFVDANPECRFIDVAITFDNLRIISLDVDYNIKVWDVKNGNILKSFSNIQSENILISSNQHHNYVLVRFNEKNAQLDIDTGAFNYMENNC